MNISTFRIFNPFSVSGGRCIISPPEKWREVEEWQRDAQQRCDVMRLFRHGDPICTSEVADNFDWQFAHAQAVLDDLESFGAIEPNRGNLGGYVTTGLGSMIAGEQFPSAWQSELHGVFGSAPRPVRPHHPLQSSHVLDTDAAPGARQGAVAGISNLVRCHGGNRANFHKRAAGPTR